MTSPGSRLESGEESEAFPTVTRLAFPCSEEDEFLAAYLVGNHRLEELLVSL